MKLKAVLDYHSLTTLCAETRQFKILPFQSRFNLKIIWASPPQRLQWLFLYSDKEKLRLKRPCFSKSEDGLLT
jgi:hypothetical protein